MEKKQFSWFVAIPVLIIVLCMTTLNSCSSKQDEVLQYYTSGEVSRKHTEVNGKKEGVMIEYYKDGKIRGERVFKNDMQVGKTTFYFPSGKIKESQYYEEGKQHGADTVFYEDGSPEFVRNFNLGMLDGYVRKWDSTGVVIYEAKFKNDTLVEVKGEPIRPDSLHQK